MVFTDTKLHTEIIKELFWNFHWGHYVSVSHLDSVKNLISLQIRSSTIINKLSGMNVKFKDEFSQQDKVHIIWSYDF